MKWEVKLYVGGTVFNEEVRAVNMQDAKTTALARNPTARIIGVNPIVGSQYLQPLNCNHIEYSIIMNREKGLNIDVTRGQYMMLYNIMCEHNQMVNPQANPDFDLQTFDNLFQAITMAKETYL